MSSELIRNLGERKFTEKVQNVIVEWEGMVIGASSRPKLQNRTKPRRSVRKKTEKSTDYLRRTVKLMIFCMVECIGMPKLGTKLGRQLYENKVQLKGHCPIGRHAESLTVPMRRYRMSYGNEQKEETIFLPAVIRSFCSNQMYGLRLGRHLSR